MKNKISFSKSMNEGFGTSLQGYGEASYDDLVEMFGTPDEYISGDGKVTFQFVVDYEIEDDYGTESGTFTIYDWKGSRPDNNSHQFTVNIGGKKIQDAWAAQQAIELFYKTDTRYAHESNVLCQGYAHAY